MKINRAKLIRLSKTLSILLIFLLFGGCVPSTPVPEYKYEENIYIRLFEPYSDVMTSTSSAFSMEIDNVSFVFWDDISEKERNDFATKQSEIFDYLSKKEVKIPDMTLYIMRDIQNRSESDNLIAFYDISSSGTYNQVLTTLQTIYGDYINYGYLYALSNYIALELSWGSENVKVTDETLVQFFKDNNPYLSLTYPCFTEKYSDTGAIQYSKALSKLLLSQMDKDSFFTDRQEQKFLSTIAKYAKENSLEYADSSYLFAYNGEYCPLKFRTSYYEAFLKSDYDDPFSEYYDWDLFSNYTNIIKTLDILQTEIEYMRELFGVTDDYIIPVTLSGLVKGGRGKVGGLYNEDEVEIAIMTAFLHEYTHYLYDCALGGNYNIKAGVWQDVPNEIVAEFYGNCSHFERMVMFNLFTKFEPDGEEAQQFEHYMGRRYQDLGDLFYANDISVYLKNDFSFADYNYLQWGSFGHYFVNTYGDDAFIKTMLKPENVAEITGNTMEEIKDDWQEHIISTYSVMDEE